MITFILYTIIYFIIGFIAAKLKKCYDEVEDRPIESDKYYATYGIMWIAYVVLWVSAFVITYVHGLYKKYL